MSLNPLTITTMVRHSAGYVSLDNAIAFIDGALGGIAVFGPEGLFTTITLGHNAAEAPKPAMYLGLFIVCLYVIFRRSQSRWRTALRMAEVFIGTLVAAVILAEAIPGTAMVVRGAAGIFALIAAVIAGFQHAGWKPKQQPPTATDEVESG